MRISRVLLAALFAPFLLAQNSNDNIVFLRIAGHDGRASVVLVGRYHYVDLDGLVRIMNASTTVENHQILLQLPGSTEPQAANEQTTSGFSHQFMASAIETIAAMREWSTTLVVAVRNSLPIGDSMVPYRGRAVDQLRLAQSLATTEPDREAFDLLNVEFQKVDTW